MTHKTTKALERAERLICAATGESYGDGFTVTNLGVGISERGEDDETLWVLGNWNPTRFPYGDDKPLTRDENLGPRLANALETYCDDIELHWLDEWLECEDCYKIFRSQPDSYLWKMFGIVTEDGTYLCANCLTWDDLEDDYVNEPTKALTFDIDLSEHGFSLFVESGDTRGYKQGTYESGFHPGQDDKPKDVLARAFAQGWSEGVFVVPNVGQFDLEFQLWVRHGES